MSQKSSISREINHKPRQWYQPSLKSNNKKGQIRQIMQKIWQTTCSFCSNQWSLINTFAAPMKPAPLCPADNCTKFAMMVINQKNQSAINYKPQQWYLRKGEWYIQIAVLYLFCCYLYFICINFVFWFVSILCFGVSLSLI